MKWRYSLGLGRGVRGIASCRIWRYVDGTSVINGGRVTVAGKMSSGHDRRRQPPFVYRRVGVRRSEWHKLAISLIKDITEKTKTRKGLYLLHTCSHTNLLNHLTIFECLPGMAKAGISARA